VEPKNFSNKSIKRSVFLEALQHPSTLFSAAVAILSSMYMGLVSFDETSFAVALGSGIFSFISWIFHYFVRGDKLAEKYIKKLQEKRRNYKELEIQNIEKKCQEAGFINGENAAKELNEAYKRLNTFLKEKLMKQKTLTAQRFLILAEESYYQGLHFLSKALSFFQALKEMDINKLKKELEVWEKELIGLKNDHSKEEEYKELIVKALNEKIHSHKKRIELYYTRSKMLDQVLAQCEVLEATLDSTYLEVVDLIEDESFTKGKNLATNLERAVEAARRVEDRLRGLGKEKKNGDSIYSNIMNNNKV
jgi:hypothetical protein